MSLWDKECKRIGAESGNEKWFGVWWGMHRAGLCNMMEPPLTQSQPRADLPTQPRSVIIKAQIVPITAQACLSH